MKKLCIDIHNFFASGWREKSLLLQCLQHRLFRRFTRSSTLSRSSEMQFDAEADHNHRDVLHMSSSQHRSARKSSFKTENRALKALRTITIILGAFVLCFTPWHVLSLIIGFCPGKDPSACVSLTLYDISYWLCYLNSPLNPFCYAFANPLFKKIFLRIIRLDWHRS